LNFSQHYLYLPAGLVQFLVLMFEKEFTNIYTMITPLPIDTMHRLILENLYDPDNYNVSKFSRLQVLDKLYIIEF